MTNERRVLVHPDKSVTGEFRRRAIHHEDARHPRRAGRRARRADRRHDGVGGARRHRGVAGPHDDRLVTGALLVGRRALGARASRRAQRRRRRASRCSTTSTCPRGTCTRSPLPTPAWSWTRRPKATLRSSPSTASTDSSTPIFDITFLGVGPDGHIASLFPHRSGIQVTDRTVIPVRNSPKPPPERLSLTRPVINASQRIWLVLAGADKASALGLALAGASRDEVPVAGIKGRRRTVFFVDADAAAEVPEALIARDY